MRYAVYTELRLAAALLTLCIVGCDDDSSTADGSPDSGNPRDDGAGAGDGSVRGGTGGTDGTGGEADAPDAMTGTGGDGADAAMGPGARGIAAQYPGDVGIAAHPDVLFADDFERYTQASELNQRWDAVYQNAGVRIATEPDNVFGGSQAVEFTVPQQDQELSNATDKLLAPEQDVLFLRYYSKFLPPFDVVGSSHNGSSISAHYFPNGQATPGVPADGTNKFLVALENWRGEAATPSPGHLNLYVYHPEQRSQWGDHWFPTGTVLPNSSEPYDFGNAFVSRPDVLQDLDRWYCYEYMVRANTPGLRDGRVTVWLDGEVVADFENLRLRDVDNLKIDRFGLSLHIGSNPAGEQKKWFDNVVAATSYIGPTVP